MLCYLLFRCLCEDERLVDISRKSVQTLHRVNPVEANFSIRWSRAPWNFTSGMELRLSSEWEARLETKDAGNRYLALNVIISGSQITAITMPNFIGFYYIKYAGCFDLHASLWARILGASEAV